MTTKNAFNDGLGFQVGIPNWSPGGFKWFNEYSRLVGDKTWLNFQANAVFGNLANRHCWYDETLNRRRCTGGHWDGIALDFIIGAKIQFDLKDVPVVVTAKVAGGTALLFFDRAFSGVAVIFRGGCYAHYFLKDHFGIGLGVNFSAGPSFITAEDIVQAYAEVDVQVLGIEYRW